MECPSGWDTVVFITSQDSSCLGPFPLNVILAFTSCRRVYALELSCPFITYSHGPFSEPFILAM